MSTEIWGNRPVQLGFQKIMDTFPLLKATKDPYSAHSMKSLASFGIQQVLEVLGSSF